MSKFAKSLNRILRGKSDANFQFDEIRLLLIKLGFEERIRGGHHNFTREGLPEILNLHPRGGRAKSYQVKQVREMIVAHGLADEPEGDEDGE